MIVPWGAGGGTDGIVRKVSTLAEKELGGTIYVENIEGGVSATGVMQAMKARPDGYTITTLTYDSVIRSEEHTSELQSLMRISYAVFCLKKQKKKTSNNTTTHTN